MILCLLVLAPAVFGQLSFNVTIASLTNNNTSAFTNYNKSTYGANFSGSTIVTPNGNTLPIDANLMDDSLNPVSPGNVSHVSVHNLISSNPKLRWFANSLGWFGDGESGHKKIGVDSTNYSYAVAMVNDLAARGFDGVIYSWYGWYNGVSDNTDILANNVKKYLQTGACTNKEFHYILMPVFGYFKGQPSGTTNLPAFESSLHYAETNYFTDTNYENYQDYTVNPISTTTNPIIMFFGVRAGDGSGFNEGDMEAAHTMDAVMSESVWVQEVTGSGGGYATEPWADQSYSWTDDWSSGTNGSGFFTDPFNQAQVGQDFKNFGIIKKPAFGSMCAHFNGSLSTWSQGKYLQSSNGLCEITRAGIYDANMATNKLITRMQWATWSDWEEGTECEDGIENWLGLTNQVSGTVLSWGLTNGYLATVDHFEIYAQTNGGNAADLFSVPTGIYQTNISQILPAGSYQLYVYAVGKACIRNHLSPPVAYTETYTGGLPFPWNNEDIGSVGVNGSTTFTNGIFTVQGSGVDIWGSSDSFQFAYQPWSGNGQIVAEVGSINAANPWAKAALMFRTSLAANSANGIIFVSPTEGVSMQSRTTTGGSTATVNTIPGTAPYWISLVLSNNVLTGYASPDGMNWTPVGTNIISLGTSFYVGMAVTSKSNSVLNTSTFSNVSVSSVASAGATLQSDLQPLFQTVWQGTPLSFAVTGGGVGILNYQWTLNGQNISGATNASYAFAALAGTNYYLATISNNLGGANSSTGEVVGEPASFLGTTNTYYGMQITCSGYTNGTSLQDFPVLVCLSTNVPGFSYAQFVSPTNGADLRFTDASGTRLIPFEIDQWNTGGVSTVWVQVPVLSTNTSIWAYWGNAAPTPALPTTNVWIPQPWEGLPSFEAVYHLKESGFPFADSTGQNPALTGIAPAPMAGVIGLGENFGGDSYLDAGVINVGSTFTLSAWVNIATNASNIQAIWASKAGSSSNGFAFYVNTYSSGGSDDQRLLFETSDHASTPTYYTVAAGDVSSNQWHQVVAVVNRAGGTAQLYVDGASIPCAGGVLTDFNTNQDVRLGEFEGNSFPLNGLMDEARIQSGLESSNWVWASYMTVAANSAFENYSLLSSPVVALNIQNFGGNVILTWPAGQLQSAGQVVGPYANVPGATSPFTNTVSGTQQFFRVKIQ